MTTQQTTPPVANQFAEVTAGQSKEMPPKIVLYGVPKIGKSTLAAEFPDVFFINIEGGLDYLKTKVRSTPKLDTFEDVLGWLKHIYESDFTCGVLAVDSIDWLEGLAREKIEKLHGGTNISDQTYKPFSYGAGMNMEADEVLKVLRWLNAIHKKKKIGSILIGHTKVKSIDLPTKDPYSRHELKLGTTLAGKVNEWADLILFADYSFHISKEGKTSEPKPTLYAGGSAAFVGGGRMKLNKEIPLNYDQLVKEITK